MEGPRKWSAPGPALALGGPGLRYPTNLVWTNKSKNQPLAPGNGRSCGETTSNLEIPIKLMCC